MVTLRVGVTNIGVSSFECHENSSSRENCYFVKFSDVHLYNKVQLFKNNFIKTDILKILPFHFITIFFSKITIIYSKGHI